MCAFNLVVALEFSGVHHVGVLCENLERSMEFYSGLLGNSDSLHPAVKGV
jgi:hypothetical protein